MGNRSGQPKGATPPAILQPPQLPPPPADSKGSAKTYQFPSLLHDNLLCTTNLSLQYKLRSIVPSNPPCQGTIELIPLQSLQSLLRNLISAHPTRTAQSRIYIASVELCGVINPLPIPITLALCGLPAPTTRKLVTLPEASSGALAVNEVIAASTLPEKYLCMFAHVDLAEDGGVHAETAPWESVRSNNYLYQLLYHNRPQDIPTQPTSNGTYNVERSLMDWARRQLDQKFLAHCHPLVAEAVTVEHLWSSDANGLIEAFLGIRSEPLILTLNLNVHYVYVPRRIVI